MPITVAARRNMARVSYLTMCRLLGYATAGFNLSLNAVLGQGNVEDFRELSEIHNDGWGVAQLADPASAPYVRDGGAPTPETGTKIYKSTIAARADSTFDALASEPARGAIWHLRLASSNLPLIMENQHPFYANGLSFIHNGDISDASGRNIVTNRSYPVDHSVFLSTGGRSDSAIFFAFWSTSASDSRLTRLWLRRCASFARPTRNPATTA